MTSSLNFLTGALLFFVSTAVPVFIVDLSLCQTEDGYWFKEADQPVLFYRAKALSTPTGTHTRANYCRPVYGLGGQLMTEDFPADHLHHRGIFWAWHQVDVNGVKVRDKLLGNRFSGDTGTRPEKLF